MIKKTLLAIGLAGLIAGAASAQMTNTTTTTTTMHSNSGGDMTTHHVMKSSHHMKPMHATRHCMMRMSHGRKMRACKTTHHMTRHMSMHMEKTTH